MISAISLTMRGDAAISAHSLNTRLARYGFASISGTVVDLALFALLIATANGAGLAAAVAYIGGTAWHWIAAQHLARGGMAYARPKSVFIGSSLLGLGLTSGIVMTASYGGLDPVTAKMISMCATFSSVWLVRLMAIFDASDRPVRPRA